MKPGKESSVTTVIDNLTTVVLHDNDVAFTQVDTRPMNERGFGEGHMRIKHLIHCAPGKCLPEEQIAEAQSVAQRLAGVKPPLAVTLRIIDTI